MLTRFRSSAVTDVVEAGRWSVSSKCSFHQHISLTSSVFKVSSLASTGCCPRQPDKVLTVWNAVHQFHYSAVDHRASTNDLLYFLALRLIREGKFY